MKFTPCTDVLGESCAWRNPYLSRRIPELDGIRGLAISFVLAWHFICESKGHFGIHGSVADLLLPLNLSWSGVDLFFVLSGFLIGGILYDAQNSNNYYRSFYFRRFYRIFPVYFTWLALFLVGLYIIGPKSSKFFNRDLPVWSYFLFLQNVFVAYRDKFGPVWMLVTWSLAVEEQFYLLLPLAIRHLSFKGIVHLILGAVLLAPLLRLALVLVGNNNGPYTLLPCRADALGVGVLLAIACRDRKTWAWLMSHKKQIWTLFLALGATLSVFVFHSRERLLNSIGYSLLAGFYGSLLLLVLVNPGRIAQVIFRNSLLMRLGRIAYAVYILHLGINGLYHYALQVRIPSNWTWCITLASLMTTVILAEVSWRLLEKPLIDRARSKYQYGSERVELTPEKTVPLGSL